MESDSKTATACPVTPYSKANTRDKLRSARLDMVLIVEEYKYTPPWGLSTLAKELSAAASVMQSSSIELSTLVADRV